jgi:tetratricopeptide (TPR) repeat protein
MNSLIKKFVIFAAVMALVAAAAWFGRKAFKRSEEHRFIAQANQYIAKKDWRNAQLCLQRVLQINPISMAAGRLEAEMFEVNGSAGALTWRIRNAKLEPNNVTNRFLWAQTAIRLENLKSAAEALSAVDDKYKSTAEYHKLSGALAWNQGRAVEAEKQYVEALRLEPGNQANLLNLETIRLASTNPAVAAAAAQSIENGITNAALRPVALRHLLTAAIARKEMIGAVGYAKEIAGDPAATFAEKIEYLQILREAKSSNYTPQLAALKAAALHSAPDAFALGQWLAKAETPDTALRWLQTLPPEIQTNLPVPLVITDCQIALKDWKGLLTFVDKQDWGEIEFYRLAVTAFGHRSLGQNAPSESDWRKALHLASHREVRLTRLAEVAAAWGWVPEKVELLRQLTDEFPGSQWAVAQLMAQLYADGNTSGLQSLLAKIHAADPADVHIENNLACVLLLRKTELDQADSLAKAAYDTATNNPFYISTYAYSLSVQKKTEEALKVLAGLNAEELKVPAIAAYYGAIQAQAGHKDIARPCLALAETAKLLPEEKEMVRLAKARL